MTLLTKKIFQTLCSMPSSTCLIAKKKSLVTTDLTTLQTTQRYIEGDSEAKRKIIDLV
ncbi:hypothetical protein [Piscirickettsia salmonis]|uniref:hypothetical protein n=1 Tax=Piscirickettsia salmonis TaxID=1238 RepID=UPI003A8129DB